MLAAADAATAVFACRHLFSMRYRHGAHTHRFIVRLLFVRSFSIFSFNRFETMSVVFPI